MQRNTEKLIKEVILKLGEECKQQRISLVTAESCTAGGIAYFISIQPGCSSILERGYIVYSDQAKTSLLNVELSTLETFGTVSEETVIQMAEGALENSRAQVSVATTGIAGDDCAGGSGIVWIGCAGVNKKTVTLMKKITGDRKTFEQKVILVALKFLLETVAGNA